jgi:serine/threonine protein kinase
MARHKAHTVEEVCEALRRSQLLSAQEVRDLEQRWKAEAEDAASLTEFTRWLVTSGYTTEYQADRLLRGGSHLFIADYKLLEQIEDDRRVLSFKAVTAQAEVVALKVLRPAQARDPSALAHFRRSASLLAGLNHPNVAGFRAAGEDHGLHYLALEHVEGQTLAQILKSRGPLPVPEVVDLGLQVLEGLQHLHEAGIVPGKLEPANLVVVGAGPKGKPSVKIVDFSLARVTGGEDTDVRSNLYNVGCVLYQALTGASPPSGALALDAVPEPIALVIATLLTDHPASGYATPAQASAALRAWQEQPRLAAQPTPPVPAASPPTLPEQSAETDWAALEGVFAPVGAGNDLEDLALPEIRTDRPHRPRHRGGLDRRDWWLLVLGAGSLLLVQGLAWVVARALVLWRTILSEPEQPKQR